MSDNDDKTRSNINKLLSALKYLQIICYAVSLIIMLASPIKALNYHGGRANADAYLIGSIVAFSVLRIVYLSVRNLICTEKVMAIETKNHAETSTVNSDDGSFSSTRYYKTYTYTVNGKEYSFERSYSGDPPYSTKTIRVNKHDPTVFRDGYSIVNDIKTTMVLAAILLGVFAVMVCVVNAA